MLRCRKCRKGVIWSVCHSMWKQGASKDERSAAVCNIWHVNVDLLPEWILTSVHQECFEDKKNFTQPLISKRAQWTVGKLNCQNCSARLGGFNFINRSECPCGQDATVHLNKSRVDHDHNHCALIVQPMRTRPRKDQAGLMTDGCQNKEQRPEFIRTELGSLNPICAMSHSSPVETSNHLPESENTQSFSFSTSQRRQSLVEDVAAIRSACSCPAGLAADLTCAGTDRSTGSPVSYPSCQLFDSDGKASVNSVACHYVSGRTRSPLHQQLLLQTVEDGESSQETMAVHEEVSDSILSLRAGSITDSVAEQEEELQAEAFMGYLASNRLSKREKNRLKGLRRKQRRRERWLHSQLEKAGSASGSLLDSEEEEEDDREGLTCAVCLEVYFSPYSCQPCGHIFCEPCLRTITKNQPTNTPCPLCRTLISRTSFHRELDQTAKTFFPKVYSARKQNFQSASYAKWPLPSSRRRFCSFWGEQRQAARAGRRLHFAHGGFTLEALSHTDMHIWLFDICLVILYIHSVNWILAFLFLCCLMYYFFF